MDLTVALRRETINNNYMDSVTADFIITALASAATFLTLAVAEEEVQNKKE